jgi:hypothetical protein
MRAIQRVVVAGLAATTTCLMTATVPAEAGAGHPQVRVVADGLNGPFELSDYGRKSVLVTESDIGQVTYVNLRTGKTRAKVTGVPGASGATRFGRFIAIITGEADPSAPPAVPGSSVLLAKPGKKAWQFADLMKYELKRNPDRQIQFDDEGNPLDALSNPFHIVRDRTGKGRFIVADAGANAVLRVGRHGKVSTLFVPPVVRSGECATAPNNTKDGFGCDPVPTGLAYGPRGRLYVSTLGAEVPGAGRVYVINPRNGHVLRTIRHLDSPTGVAVSGRGTVFVSNVLEGAPPGEEPPPGFDPSTVGEITRIGRHGGRSTAQVTMPTGLLWKHGALYSSAWSIAGFLGMSDAGQVVKVSGRAFR